MSTTSERIKEGLQLRDMKQADLVRATGIGKSSISTYIAGEYIPKQKNIYKIAKALNVNEAWLMGEDVPMERTLPPSVSPFDYENINPITKRKYKYLGEIACGEPVFADEQYETYIDLECDINADFVLKAKGDSMINARIYDGDIVFIKEQNDVSDGEIAAVIIDDEATLKRVYKYDDHISLNAENPAYKPIQVKATDAKNVRIIGKAISAMIRIK